MIKTKIVANRYNLFDKKLIVFEILYSVLCQMDHPVYYTIFIIYYILRFCRIGLYVILSKCVKYLLCFQLILTYV